MLDPIRIKKFDKRWKSRVMQHLIRRPQHPPMRIGDGQLFPHRMCATKRLPALSSRKQQKIVVTTRGSIVTRMMTAAM